MLFRTKNIKETTMRKKILALLMFSILTCLVLVGCDGKSDSTSSIEGWEEDGVTLTWWLVGGTDEYYTHYWSEMKSFQELQKRTNISIDFNVAINYDAYLPMMTAKTYPHIITAKNLERYTGRLAGMYDDGVSVVLNDYMEEYMPNFTALIEEYPNLGRDIRLEGGVYTFLSTFYDSTDDMQRALTSTYGLVIRQDWLDNVGMDVPTDMAEWYKVLKAFKQQDPNGNGSADEEPYVACSSGWKYFLPAYGIDDDPSVMKDENGEDYVVYGYMTDNYKEYLAEMNKWYTEGLIYNMFENTSLEKQSERVTQNFAGAWKGGTGNFDEDDESSFLNLLKEGSPNVELSACPWPKTADGYQWCFSDISSFHRDTTVITSNAVKDGVDKAAAYLLDYMLSEEGSNLLTWGIEGESYEEVGGEKQLMDGMTDTVTFYGKQMPKINTYADNLTVAFPCRGDVVAEYVYSQKSDEYREASYTWATGDISYKMQAPCQLTVELEEEANQYQDDMLNYISKMRQRFVSGRIPLTEYDSYLEQVDLMGGSKFVDCWQQAYDSYMTR